MPYSIRLLSCAKEHDHVGAYHRAPAPVAM
jgi:hypothetical protein